MSGVARRRGRAGHRRQPRHRRGRRRRTRAAAARMWCITARTQGGLEETDDAIRAAGGEATLLPLDLRERRRRSTRIGPTLFAALRPAGHPGAQRRRARAADAGAAHPAERLGRGGGGEPRRHLAADPHAATRCCARPPPGGRCSSPTAAAAGAARLLGRHGATKAGMEHLALTWAQELATTPLRVNLFDPGPVATRMRCRRSRARTSPRCPPRKRSRRRWRRCACRRRSGTGYCAGRALYQRPMRPTLPAHRHGPACPGHPRQHGAATGGPDEPGHDVEHFQSSLKPL